MLGVSVTLSQCSIRWVRIPLGLRDVSFSKNIVFIHYAGGARLVVRLTCNQKAVGSSPTTSSRKKYIKTIKYCYEKNYSHVLNGLYHYNG